MARTRRPKNWDVPGPVKSELYLTERDHDIFRLLDPEYGYHYLPSNWIHAFIGGDQLRLAKRLETCASPATGPDTTRWVRDGWRGSRIGWPILRPGSRSFRSDRLLNISIVQTTPTLRDESAEGIRPVMLKRLSAAIDKRCKDLRPDYA